jgi:hypothetical protein
MIELEVYAAGVRELDKIMQLDHLLEDVSGLRYKIDSNHDIVYMEFDQPPGMDIGGVRATFQKVGLRAQFVGAIHEDLRNKSKTQRLRV